MLLKEKKRFDYYAFGMEMPGRSIGSDFAYNFNGKRTDKWNGDNGSYIDFGARIHDTRLGRFLSRDLLESDYPGYSPYNFVANNPILFKDLDGNKIFIYYDTGKKDKDGQPIFGSYEYGSSISPPRSRYVKRTIKTLDRLKQLDRFGIVKMFEESTKDNIAVAETDKWFGLGAFIIEVGNATVINSEGKIISQGDMMDAPDIISWCTKSGYIDENGKNRQSAANALLHELAHKYYYLVDPEGTEKSRRDLDKIIDNDEFNAASKKYYDTQKQETGEYHNYAERWIIKEVEPQLKEGVRRNHSSGYFLRTIGGPFSRLGWRLGLRGKTGTIFNKKKFKKSTASF